MSFAGSVADYFLRALLHGIERVRAGREAADAAGVFTVNMIYMTRDGESYVYSYRRMLSDLYLASGF